MGFVNFAKRKLEKMGLVKAILIEPTYCTPEKLLSGKKAIVIGGGTGIGYAIAKKLNDSGCEVIIASRSYRETNKEGVHFVKWDIEDIGLMQQKFDKIIQQYGQIDIIVNSQGVCPKVDFQRDFYNVDIEDFEKVMSVNLRSVYFICQMCCEYFEKNKIAGNILNIASIDGLKGTCVPYGISKSAVISLTKGLGKKMIGKGIVVNGIAPGATATAMMGMQEKGDLKESGIPSGRTSTSEEIANVALLMVSDMGQQMCGEIVTIDGGESLH